MSPPRSAATRPTAPRPDDGAPSARPVLVLWWALAALVAVRLAVPLLPTMWAWSLAAPRFLPPLVAWGPWLLVVLALLPATGRPAGRLMLRVGEVLGARPALALVLAALAGGLLVWSLPDRLSFVGDFQVRRGILLIPDRANLVFPQALWLDLLLHVRLPHALTVRFGLTADVAARLVGAVDAALLAALAAVFARRARLTGGAALAATATLFFGGYLAGLTGYGKAFCELTVLAAAAAVCCAWFDQRGWGLLGLAACAVVALSLHRSGIALLVPLGWAWIEWLRAYRREWRRPVVWLALALTAAALGLLPGLVALVQQAKVQQIDTGHIGLSEIRQAGWLRTTFGAIRLADMVNLVLLISPLAPLALVPPGTRRGALLRTPAHRLLVALALPMVAGLVLLHPGQGMFRDWDDYFMFGVAFSALAAWSVGHVLQERPHVAWLACAVALAGAVPTVQWLALNHEKAAGLAWTRAVIQEPPQRTIPEQAMTWTFIGLHAYNTADWKEASRCFSRAVEATPTPRLLVQWGMTEQMQDHFQQAQGLYARAAELSPDFAMAWMGLGSTSTWLGDDAQVLRATRELLRLAPDSTTTRGLVDYLERKYPNLRE